MMLFGFGRVPGCLGLGALFLWDEWREGVLVTVLWDLREELRMCDDEGCVMSFGCMLMWLERRASDVC